MNAHTLSPLILIASATLACAQARAPITRPLPPPTPPPIRIAPPEPVRAAPLPVASPQDGPTYDQRPLNGRPVLVTSEQAQTIISRFREGYPNLGKPRFLVHINRELVDEQSGLKLSARSEQTEIARGQGERDLERATNKLTYRVRERKPTPLADKQSLRDVEHIFVRPLRLAGASIVDQRVATQLMADQGIKALTIQTEGEQARKDREAISKIADVAIEVLMSSREVTVPEVSGNRTYSLPDLQVTAIRLSDSTIIGQASAADLIGDDRAASRLVRHITNRDIIEAVSLSLMEDMLQ